MPWWTASLLEDVFQICWLMTYSYILTNTIIHIKLLCYIYRAHSEPGSVGLHIQISKSSCPDESRWAKGTRRKSTGGKPWNLPGKLWAADFNLSELIPFSDTTSYKKHSFDELGPIQVITMVCPILCVPLDRRKRTPSFSACKTRKVSFLLNETGNGQSYWKRLPESQCSLLKWDESCLEESTNLQFWRGHGHGA